MIPTYPLYNIFPYSPFTPSKLYVERKLQRRAGTRAERGDAADRGSMREGTSRKQGYGFGFRVGGLGFRCRGRERRGKNEGGTEDGATLLNF